jgi:hypothetical protein
MDAGGSIGSMSSAQPSLAEMEAPLQMGQAGPGGGVPSPKQNVMIAHCAFKSLALLVYLGSGFSSNYVTTFVMVTVLSALDFWTGTSLRLRRAARTSHSGLVSRAAAAGAVKNITGRLLVGLRWCNFIDEAVCAAARETRTHARACASASHRRPALARACVRRWRGALLLSGQVEMALSEL